MAFLICRDNSTEKVTLYKKVDEHYENMLTFSFAEKLLRERYVKNVTRRMLLNAYFRTLIIELLNVVCTEMYIKEDESTATYAINETQCKALVALMQISDCYQQGIITEEYSIKKNVNMVGITELEIFDLIENLQLRKTIGNKDLPALVRNITEFLGVSAL